MSFMSQEELNKLFGVTNNLFTKDSDKVAEGVDKLYEDLLGVADPSDDGATYWEDIVQKEYNKLEGFNTYIHDTTEVKDAKSAANLQKALASASEQLKSTPEYKTKRITESVEKIFNEQLYRSPLITDGSNFWIDEALESLGEGAWDEEAYQNYEQHMSNAIAAAPESQLQDIFVDVLGGPASQAGLQYWLDPKIKNPLHSGGTFDYGDDPNNYGGSFDPGSGNWLGIGDPLDGAGSDTGFIGNQSLADVDLSVRQHVSTEGDEYNSLTGEQQVFYNPETGVFEGGETRAEFMDRTNQHFNIGDDAGGGYSLTEEDLINAAQTSLGKDNLEDIKIQNIASIDYDQNPDTPDMKVAPGFGAVNTGNSSVYPEELINLIQDNAVPFDGVGDGLRLAWSPFHDAAASTAPGGGPAMSDVFINQDPDNPYTGPGSDIPGAGDPRVEAPPGTQPLPWGQRAPGTGEPGPTMPLGPEKPPVGPKPPPGSQPNTPVNPYTQPESPWTPPPAAPAPPPSDPGPPQTEPGGPGGNYPGWPDYGYGGYDPVGGVRIRKPGRDYKNASGWFSRSGKRLSSNPDLKIAPNNQGSNEGGGLTQGGQAVTNSLIGSNVGEFFDSHPTYAAGTWSGIDPAVNKDTFDQNYAMNRKATKKRQPGQIIFDDAYNWI
jgi:hypothetical protein